MTAKSTPANIQKMKAKARERFEKTGEPQHLVLIWDWEDYRRTIISYETYCARVSTGDISESDFIASVEYAGDDYYVDEN